MTISNERLQERVQSQCGRTHYEGFFCAVCEAKQMARELLERRKADRWIPVKYGLPPLDEKVQVRCSIHQSAERGTCELSLVRRPEVCGGELTWASEDGYFAGQVFSWRPLPTPPEQGGPQ